MVFACIACGACVVVACVVRFGGGAQSPRPMALGAAAAVLFVAGVILNQSLRDDKRSR